MSWVLIGRRAFLAGIIALAVALAIPAGHEVAPAPTPALAPFALTSVGGGSGGTSGSGIWAEAWWNGNPSAGGPYIGPAPEEGEICIWHDLGPGLEDLNSGLTQSSLPVTFWKQPDGGGHPGIWGIDQWADGELLTTKAGHFDLVACPNVDQVPAPAPDVETDIPEATPPKGPPLYVWLLWDTVPDPGSGSLPPIIDQALRDTQIPAPGIGTSPFEVGGIADSTVVNLATWLWTDPGHWHTYSARAEAGDIVATVWAVPVYLHWTVAWNFPYPSDDPEGGTTFGPEILDQTCDGPGTIYELGGGPDQTTDCSFDFTQSTFGTSQNLQAAVTWDVTWALSNKAGMVGGEGQLAPVMTSSSRPIRVLQVESVIASG